MKRMLPILLFMPVITFSQPKPVGKNFKTEPKGTQITLPTWNKIINRSFSSVLGTNTNNTTIGNYATFDPVDGSMTFKGSIAIGNDSTKKVNYLGLTLHGDLVSQSYTALFSNTKLNTSSGIQADYHFRLGRNRFITNRSATHIYALKKMILDSLHSSEFKKVTADKFLTEQRQALTIRQSKVLKSDLIDLRKKIDAVETLTTTAFSKQPVDNSSAKKWTDSLTTLIKKMESLVADSISAKLRYDSLEHTVRLWQGLSEAKDEQIDKDHKKMVDSLDAKFTLDGVTFNWITLVAGTGRKTYYTFYDSLPLATQLAKEDLTTWKLGSAWNIFWQDLFLKRSIYFNGGFFRAYDNNTALLSTASVNQERIFKNVAGDTVRKVVNKYDAYDEPITSVKHWQFYANFYYLFGARTSGFHIFPSFISPDHDKSYGSLGLGYVVSFINNKKDEPVINAEGYIQFVDIFNQLESEFNFIKRSEIGVRFSLPIALLTK